MRVNTGPLKKGLDKGRASINKFGSAINPLKGGVAGLVTGLLAAAGAALTVRAAIRGVSEQFAKIDHLAKFSKSVGVSIDELRGLSMAAGLSGASGEVLEKSLVKMNKLMGEAQLGFGAGAKAFSDLGIEMKDLEGLGTADALGLISDKIKDMPNVAQKTAASMTLMGRSGSELAGFLELGSDKIKEMIDENTKLQGSISDFDAAGIENMNDSLDRLKSVFTGIFQQIALKVAPVIDGLIKTLMDTGTTGLDVGAMVTKGFNFIVKGVGIAADVIDIVRIGFLFLQAGMTKGLGLLLRWWGFLGKGIESVINLIPGVSVNFADTVTEMGKAVEKLGDEDFKHAMEEFIKPPPSVKINAFFDDLNQAIKQSADAARKDNPAKVLSDAQIEANKIGFSAIQSLQDQIQTLKLGADAAAVFRLEQDGISKSIIEQVKALQKQKSALEEAQKTQEKLKSAAQGVIDSLKSPLDKFGDRLGELKELFNKGLIDEQQFLKAEVKLKTEVQDNLGLKSSPIDKLEDLKELFSKGLIDKQQFLKSEDELKSAALNKFGDRLGELKTLFNKGLIDEPQFLKAAKIAQVEILGEPKETGKQGFAGVALAGSREARQSILRNRFGGSKDPLNDIKKTNKNVADNTAESNRLLKESLKEVKKDVILVIAG